LQEPDRGREHHQAKRVHPAENPAGKGNRKQRVEEQSESRKTERPEVLALSRRLERNQARGTADNKLQYDCVAAFGCPEENSPDQHRDANPFHDFCKHNNLNSPGSASAKREQRLPSSMLLFTMGRFYSQD
jgi:hypothetical protein